MAHLSSWLGRRCTETQVRSGAVVSHCSPSARPTALLLLASEPSGLPSARDRLHAQIAMIGGRLNAANMTLPSEWGECTPPSLRNTPSHLPHARLMSTSHA